MSGIQAPASGARLDAAAAEALIARRLVALDHPPDLLDPGAVAALVADARGSGRRLRTTLAATLFLASTEDAPRIDAALVRRALAAQATPLTPIAVDSLPAGRPRIAPRHLLLAITAAALAIGLVLIVLQPHTPAPEPRTAAILPLQSPAAAPPPPAQSQDQPPSPEKLQSQAAQPPASQAQPAPPRTAPPPASSQPGPARPPPVLAPLPPPVAVAAPPAPPSGGAPNLQPQAALPQAAPASILLLYPASRPSVLTQLRPVAEALHRAGYTDIRARPVHAPPPRRAVSFFYSDDKSLADAVARTLAGVHWPRLNGVLLQPSLVLLPAGLPSRSPGAIEIQLP